jgi:energy-coupling factor transport system substrate-specific component
MLNGLFAGFNLWWLPYTYIWTLLWGATMLLPRNMPKKAACIVYSVVCSLHGFLFGILYSPAQALMFGLDFKQTVAWVMAGIPYDVIHGVSNFGLGLLVLPLSETLKKLSRGRARG